MSRQTAAIRGRKRIRTIEPLLRRAGYEVEYVVNGSRINVYGKWVKLHVHIDWKRGSYRLRVRHQGGDHYELVMKKKQPSALVEAMKPQLEVEDARHRLTGA